MWLNAENVDANNNWIERENNSTEKIRQYNKEQESINWSRVPNPK